LTKKPYSVFLSLEKKILINLWDFKDKDDLWDMDPEVSQPGMSRLMGVSSKQVSRALVSLKERDLIRERTAHVRGEARRRKVYLLTSQGKTETRNILDFVSDRSIRVVGEDGRVHVVKLRDIKGKYIHKLRLIEVILLIQDGSPFDPGGAGSISGYAEKGKDEGTGNIHFRSVSAGIEIPSVEGFVGRQHELDRLTQMVSDPKPPNVVSVQGIAGIGKTSLAAAAVSPLKGKKPVFWYRFESYTLASNLLAGLSNFLGERGRRSLSEYLSANEEPRFDEIMERMAMDLEGSSSVLVFDDVHRARGDSLAMLTSLVSLTKTGKGHCVILLGRKIPRVYDPRDVVVDRSVVEVRLEGLDKDSALSIMGKSSLTVDGIDRIYEATKGHPLALKMIRVPQHLGALRDFHRFLEEEILGELNPFQKSFLELASVYRRPMPPDAFSSVEGLTRDMIVELRDRGIVDEGPNGGLGIHDLLRETLLTRLMPGQKRELHQLAADHMDEGDTKDSWKAMERIHHLLEAGDPDAAALCTLERGPSIANEGYVELAGLLDRIQLAGTSRDLTDRLGELKGDLYVRTGALDRALAQYGKTLRRALKQKDKNTAARGLRKMGDIYGQRGQWSKTIRSLKKALELVRQQNDKREEARLLNNLGTALGHVGEPRKAGNRFKESASILTEIGDPVGASLAHMNMALMMEEYGKKREALTQMRSVRKSFRENGYLEGEAEAAIHLARMGGFDPSPAVKLRGILDSLVGMDEVTKATEMAVRLGQELEGLRRFKDALEVYQDAMIRLEGSTSGGSLDVLMGRRTTDWKVREEKHRGLLIDLLLGSAVCYRKLSKHQKAINYLERAESVLDRDDRKRVEMVLERGSLEMAMGKHSRASASYLEAQRLLRDIKDWPGVVTCMLLRGDSELLAGRKGPARDCYRKAKDLAIKVGFDSGVKRAKRGLRNLRD